MSKDVNKEAIFYGAVGATFLTIGIGLVVASLYVDSRILIVAAVACILAGYCIYKAHKQKGKGVSSNLNYISSATNPTNVENHEKKEPINKKIDISFIGEETDPGYIQILKDFFTQDDSNCYSPSGILLSLFDLLVHSWHSSTNPLILLQGVNTSWSLSDEFTRVSELHDNRDIIYIKLYEGMHWLIFYFFKNNEQKKLLLIDSLKREDDFESLQGKLENFLIKRNYGLYVSTTGIQQDGYSCGLIASEVTRMIYSDHENLKDKLKKKVHNNKKIEINSCLPKDQLQQLSTSLQEKGQINFGDEVVTLYASNFKAAHIATAALHFIPIIADINVSYSSAQTCLNMVLKKEEINYENFKEDLTSDSEIKKEIKAIVQKVQKTREDFIYRPNVKLPDRNTGRLSEASMVNINGSMSNFREHLINKLRNH